jgi:hypothetical protein
MELAINVPSTSSSCRFPTVVIFVAIFSVVSAVGRWYGCSAPALVLSRLLTGRVCS